jgi:aminoglycoside phosphotransferase (APT) family kinase protein
MASREYSQRLGTLTDTQLQAALDRFGLGTFISAEPAQNGLFGQNLLIESTGGRFVFRGAPHWNPAGEDDWQFPKEQFFCRAVHESGLGPPVAWPYMIDEGRDIFGWGFAVQPRLSGGPLIFDREHRYTAAEQIEFARELGTALGMLHRVKLGAPADYDVRVRGLRQIETTYFDYVRNTVMQIVEGAAKHSPETTTGADVTWARDVIERAREALEEPFEACVTHMDFGLHNVLFEHQDAWRLTGVIDWHTAEAGHPEADLARALCTNLQYRTGTTGAFLESYRQFQPEIPGATERMGAFILWERSLMWGYWQRQPERPLGDSMRGWMEPFVEGAYPV